ncbi:MAG: Spy/CpxP family protein refolding chaperone [bacterium]|nr:Spy/CpxP family protein refolding chaperone [bacterium]
MHRHLRWWARHGGAPAWAFAGGCSPVRDHEGGHEHRHVDRDWIAAFASRMDAGELGGGDFGVRRPLRYLAHKLELDEEQTADLATILGDLKTERAQAEVDTRRAMAAFADAVAGDTYDVARAGEGGTTRVRSAERLREVVERALGRIHALLRPEQRRRLAYLIRSGTLRL